MHQQAVCGATKLDGVRRTVIASGRGCVHRNRRRNTGQSDIIATRYSKLESRVTMIAGPRVRGACSRTFRCVEPTLVSLDSPSARDPQHLRNKRNPQSGQSHTTCVEGAPKQNAKQQEFIGHAASATDVVVLRGCNQVSDTARTHNRVFDDAKTANWIYSLSIFPLRGYSATLRP